MKATREIDPADKKPLQVEIGSDLHRRVKAKAAEMGITMAAFVTMVLAEALKD